jgi:hypothetical protein
MMERRRSQRFAPEEEIYARIKSSIPVRIVDVSNHGMQVESTSALPPSGECDVWLPTDDGDVRMRIRVQRCRARFLQTDDGFRGLMYQAGLEFLEMDNPAKSALVSIVERLDVEDVAPDEISPDGIGGADEMTAGVDDRPEEEEIEEKGHEVVPKAV